MIRRTFLLFLCATLAASAQRRTREFDADWHFHLGDPENASAADFDHARWKKIDLPHDWAFQNGVSQDGAQRDAGGYYSGGIGWYRKTFQLPALKEDQRALIEFDGVYMNSEVWINGKPLGKFPYGYLTFSHELTTHLKDGENTIAVRCDNSKEPSARWYHPCGIYAPVRLITTHRSNYLTDIQITTPKVTKDSATINIASWHASGDHDNNIQILYEVTDPNGRVVHKSTKNSFDLPKPLLWDLDTPRLYKLTTRLVVDGKTQDQLRTRFGIRDIEWKADTGFWLNGRNIKLKGVCEHWEGGPVGGAWTKDLMRWKIKTIKSMGCNSIRTAHNPCPPFFYDLCDEMGMLVMDEIFDGWLKKAPFDYGQQAFADHWEQDLRSWLKRDRNHPSIVIWSLGNETRGPVAPDMVKVCHELDPTRPVTSGHSGSEHMDVYGVNGHSEKQTFYTNYKRPKDKPFIATEAPHTWQVRGYYRAKTWFRDGFPNKRQAPFPCPDLSPEEIFTYDWTAPGNRANRKQIFNSSYDNAMVRMTARKGWEKMRDLPWFSGHFRWTGFDYPGEAGYVHGGWPFRAFMGGTHDLAGFPKDTAFFYQSQWTSEPMVHLLPHWTHPKMEKGTKIPVVAYSNAEEVELFLNDKSLGIRKPGRKAEDMQCEWSVPWKKGTITAIARRNGKEVARHSHTTAGAPASLALKAEPSGKEIVVTTTIRDKAGIHTPYADNRIHYHLSGDSSIRSLENGNPVDTENGSTMSSRRAFMGLNRAFIHTEGALTLNAFAILGSRNGVTSDQFVVNIARSAFVYGPQPKHTVKILYTTNGSPPNEKSPVYTGPFTINFPATVKALVLHNGKPILDMEERFDRNQGLYWITGKERVGPNSSAGMQAENAKLSNGAKVAKKGDDFRGTGFVDMPEKEATITWYQENDGSAGTFNLRFRYANGDPNGFRNAHLIINGKKVKTLKFLSGRGWNKDWQLLNTSVQLTAGANEIILRAGDRGGPTIDELLVE